MNGLLVDDDELFARTLQRSLARRNVLAQVALDGASALELVRSTAFDFALVDLKIERESGLKLIAPMKALRPCMRLVMMTGYASVATAVDAIKSGADDYLPKPASLEAILRALTDEANLEAEDEDGMIPLGRIEWEHIQQALRATDGNVSAAARLLGVHRRSLQRKLAKRPPS